MKIGNKIGPGLLVTAAFIGPGTLTTCSLAGVKFGYDLIWVLMLATIATIILQGMAARLGVVTGSGLGEALKSQLKNPLLRSISLSLVFIAIIIGNAAYEMGNVTGAVLGLEREGFDHLFWGPLIIGAIVTIILWHGNTKRIQAIMGLLVLIMSLVFITSAVLVGSFSGLIEGLTPRLSSENQLTALALIGTTIVPYNLFLHASASSEHWKSTDQLPEINRETFVTIFIGGIISMCVLVTAASGEGGIVQGVADMSRQLEPLLGNLARPFLAIGIFAAGISSALTAPLAAALTAKGIFGWEDKSRYRLVWGTILLLGVVFSMLRFKPILVIQIAQVANGILLPIIVTFLVLMCNNQPLMGQHKNSFLQNALGVLILLVSLIISVRSFNSVFHFLG